MLRSASTLRSQLAKHEGPSAYRDLAAQLELLGTDLKAMLGRIRALREDPILMDARLRSEPDRMIAMDRLLEALVRVVRETQSMPDPLSTVALP